MPARMPLKAGRKAAGSLWQSEAPERPAVIHSSLCLPEPVYEALRKIAFDERAKIHDLAMEGIDAVLRRRDYPSIDSLKARKKR